MKVRTLFLFEHISMS